MPFINVKTNLPVKKEKLEVIKSSLGKAISDIPGKSESWLMVNIEGGCSLFFKGTDEPAAMVEVSVYGNASPAALSALTSDITDTLGDSLGIADDRIYVSYMCTPHWGWNGSNF